MRASILMGGVLVAVLVAMRLVRTDDSLQPEALTNGMTEDKASVPPISRSAPAQGPPRSGIRASDHGTAGGQTSTDTQLAGSDVISGEYVLHFYDEQDRQAFEAVARRLGVRIIDTLTFSHAIRIRVRSSDQLRELLDKGPTPTDWMPNRYVRSPEPEDGNTPLPPEAGYQAFGNQTLAWLGIGENATWGSGITVGILDTGVARSLRNGIARLDLVGESSTVATHGTAVASLIVGDDASLQGIAPDADLLSIKVLSDEGIGDAFTLAKGIIEAVDRGARVLTCSLGSRGDSSILSEAVRYAMARDVVLVAAAGNGAVSGVLYPARYEGVIAVAAVDAAGRHLYFSNRGTEVSLAAPGAGVMAAHPEGFPISFTGTSAAVPLVAGT
ncbi:MAG: S8 family serine peptidase, partial [Verrucomicrobia bacterium]|nr:S8 family serine peptidase [Verrucomicrobiota bacterium]